MGRSRDRIVAILLLILSGSFGPTRGFAATPPSTQAEYEKEVRQIPRKTTAPPKLGLSSPAGDAFRCERLFIYRGKALPCDSNIRQDAERLRPILESVPPAIDELDIYQRNRRWVRNLAYIGTAGILVALASRLISPDPQAKVISARELTLIGGLGISGGSLLYGLSFLRTNEAHLGAAVDAYNKANPKDPVQLQFSTGISF